MKEELLYNIGIVTRLTGISITTLHAWDRRYKFPGALRSPGGHRLYTEMDINRLRWVKSQVDSGLAPSRAIYALRSHEEETHSVPIPKSVSNDLPLKIPPTQFQDTLFNALISHDSESADRLMGEVLAFYSPDELIINLIAPTMARLGEAWAVGSINVATEHFATNFIRHRLLMWMLTGPAARSKKPVILACAPGEWHEGSLLMVGVLLRRRGWPILYLGQNVPIQSISDLTRDISPSAILFIAMQAESALNLINWPSLITQTSGQPPILLGGRAFIMNPGLLQQIPGIYLGNTIQDGIIKIESILLGELNPGTPIQNPQ